MAKHEVYHDIDLIEATLKDCGIDIENPGTFHGLNANRKAKVVEKLAGRSGATTTYCRFVVFDYFGQNRGTSNRAKESLERGRAARIAATKVLPAVGLLDDVRDLLMAAGIRPRSKKGKAILAALEHLGPDLPYDERSRLKLQRGVNAAQQLRALEEILDRHRFGHLFPKQQIRAVKC